MSRSREWLGLALWILVCEGTGFVASQWKPGAWHAALVKPAWNPPNWVFPPVWILLYALMGIAAWLVWRSAEAPGRRAALGFFFVQLALNGAWSWIFFGRHALGAAFVEIVLLWLAILATLFGFRRVSRPAAWLLVPYLVWVTFATALTFAMWRLNGASGSAEKVSIKSDGWEEVRIGTDAVFSGLHFVDSRVGWIVGGSPFVDGGVVGRTEDGGRTWRYVTGVTKGGRASGLSAVHGFDRMRVCAAGDGVFLTFDGGASWQRATAPGARFVIALDFLDGNEGWAAGATGVFHTTDAGLTWAVVDREDSAARHVNGRVLHFTDARSGWLAGKHGALLRTRDGGATWARVPIPAPANTEHAPDLLGGAWPDAAHGWLVGEYGTVLRTEDRGDTWTLVDAGPRDAVFTGVAFAGADGWIVGFLPNNVARSVVTRTRDGGATWALERTLDGEELRAIQALDADTAWAVGGRVRTEPQRMIRRARPPG